MLMSTKPELKAGIWIQVQTPKCTAEAHRPKGEAGPERKVPGADSRDYMLVQTCCLGNGIRT